MDTISAILDERCIALSLKSRRKKDVISELADLLRDAAYIGETHGAVETVLARERLGSTGIGGGIAIPHGRLDAMTRTVLALGRSAKGIDFAAIDGRPVKLVFLILGPPNAAAEHLRLLSRLARLLHAQSFADNIIAAADTQSILRVIREQEQR